MIGITPMGPGWFIFFQHEVQATRQLYYGPADEDDDDDDDVAIALTLLLANEI